MESNREKIQKYQSQVLLEVSHLGMCSWGLEKVVYEPLKKDEDLCSLADT